MIHHPRFFAGRSRQPLQPVVYVLPLSLFLGGLLGYLLQNGSSFSCSQLLLLLPDVAEPGVPAAFGSAFVQTLFLYLRVPFLALVLSTGVWGRFCLPALEAAQGFVLSFCLLALADCGRGGFLLALVCFGPRLLFSIPVSLYIAQRRWEVLFHKNRPEPPVWGYLLLCLLLLSVGAAVEGILFSRFFPVILQQF